MNIRINKCDLEYMLYRINSININKYLLSKNLLRRKKRRKKKIIRSVLFISDSSSDYSDSSDE